MRRLWFASFLAITALIAGWRRRRLATCRSLPGGEIVGPRPVCRRRGGERRGGERRRRFPRLLLGLPFFRTILCKSDLGGYTSPRSLHIRSLALSISMKDRDRL